jgi:hypothetical protein
MNIFDRLMFLAKGGKSDYLHKGKENMKTSNLQDFLDEVVQRATDRVKKRIDKCGKPEDSPVMKRFEEQLK